MSEGLERFPVAFSTYADPRFEYLNVDAEARKIAAVSADFETQRVDWDTPADQRNIDAVNARLDRSAKSTGSQSFLYRVGHGWSDGCDTALANCDSSAAVRTQGVSAQCVADAVPTWSTQLAEGEPDQGPSLMIVVVDACQSAALIRELKFDSQCRATVTSAGCLRIGGRADAGATDLGRFSRELRIFLDTAHAAEFEVPLRRMAVQFDPQGAEGEQQLLADAVVLRRRHSILLGHFVVQINPTLRTGFHRRRLHHPPPSDEHPQYSVFDTVLPLTTATTGEVVVAGLVARAEHRTRYVFTHVTSGLDKAEHYPIQFNCKRDAQ